MNKVLQHPIIKDVLPHVVGVCKNYEVAYQVLKNLRGGWEGVKTCCYLDDIHAMNFVSSSMIILENS